MKKPSNFEFGRQMHLGAPNFRCRPVLTTAPVARPSAPLGQRVISTTILAAFCYLVNNKFGVTMQLTCNANLHLRPRHRLPSSPISSFAYPRPFIAHAFQDLRWSVFLFAGWLAKLIQDLRRSQNTGLADKGSRLICQWDRKSLQHIFMPEHPERLQIVWGTDDMGLGASLGRQCDAPEHHLIIAPTASWTL
jgi:hypothetical protein